MSKNHELYVAKRILNKENEYGETTAIYSKPIHYNFLYMPTRSQVDYQIYGEEISKLYVSFVKYNQYRNIFHRGDRAYLLDDEMQDLSVALKDTNCENANYEILSVNEQNAYIKITFKKIEN